MTVAEVKRLAWEYVNAWRVRQVRAAYFDRAREADVWRLECAQAVIAADGRMRRIREAVEDAGRTEKFSELVEKEVARRRRRWSPIS